MTCDWFGLIQASITDSEGIFRAVSSCKNVCVLGSKLLLADTLSGVSTLSNSNLVTDSESYWKSQQKKQWNSYSPEITSRVTFFFLFKVTKYK